MADVFVGDCVEVMRGMPEGSIDAIVTDPPYDLAFMGKAWDDGIDHPVWAREALRVVKPGAHLVAFGGTRTFHRLACALEDAGWEIRDCLMWLYGSGFPKSRNLPGGWGTALKPAWEPIILARKPLNGTVAENVLEHGTGALNIDASRIGRDSADTSGWSRSGSGASDNRAMSGPNYARGPKPDAVGRWPANLVLDEEAARQLDEATGDVGGNLGWSRSADTNGRTSYGLGAHGVVGYGDSGGASRFFYTAKAARSERGDGNTHPTVKPFDLMRWLVRLVTPPGGLVLDPFAGSGTTLIAARAEGFRFIGIEREAEYIDVVKSRLSDGPLFGLPTARSVD